MTIVIENIEQIKEQIDALQIFPENLLVLSHLRFPSLLPSENTKHIRQVCILIKVHRGKANMIYLSQQIFPSSVNDWRRIYKLHLSRVKSCTTYIIVIELLVIQINTG